MAPHVACKHGVCVAGWDGRTTARSGYRFRHKLRKLVREIVGCIQTGEAGEGAGIENGRGRKRGDILWWLPTICCGWRS